MSCPILLAERFCFHPLLINVALMGLSPSRVLGQDSRSELQPGQVGMTVARLPGWYHQKKNPFVFFTAINQSVTWSGKHSINITKPVSSYCCQAQTQIPLWFKMQTWIVALLPSWHSLFICLFPGCLPGSEAKLLPHHIFQPQNRAHFAFPSLGTSSYFQSCTSFY